MAYDQHLADRVEDALKDYACVSIKKMFGGLCFMFDGNMLCGVLNDTLMLRVGKNAYESVLAREHAGPMLFTGRPLTTMVTIMPEGVDDEDDLREWIELALSFVRTLPPK